MGDKELDIIIDFSRGDEKAFRVLYDKYVVALRYFAAKYLNEDTMIDDVVQDAFVDLWDVFNELPPACKEVYQMSLDGKSHEEIAQMLNISVNTVKKHKNNANHYMRERLKNVLSLLAWIS